MEHHTAGDPISGLKWTRKTTLKISGELRKAGIVVSPKTVGRLLKGLKFWLFGGTSGCLLSSWRRLDIPSGQARTGNRPSCSRPPWTSHLPTGQACGQPLRGA